MSDSVLKLGPWTLYTQQGNLCGIGGFDTRELAEARAATLGPDVEWEIWEPIEPDDGG